MTRESNNKKMIHGRAASAGLTAAAVIFILSASVAVPLLWRGFFYLHVRLFRMTEYLPWSYEEICEAYNEMMDFCIFGGEFSTGVLKWSEEGMRHFEDCRVLFRLDLILLLISGAVLAAFLILTAVERKKDGGNDRTDNTEHTGHGPFFLAGIIPSAGFILLVLLIWAVGFDRAFIVFHQLFFPGKDNWIFDPMKDEIINILPEQFFMDCALLIVVFIMLWSAVFIIADRKLRKA